MQLQRSNTAIADAVAHSHGAHEAVKAKREAWNMEMSLRDAEMKELNLIAE